MGDLKAHWGVRALLACVFSLPQGVLEPPRTSDYTAVVVSGGLGSTGCEAPSPFLVVTEISFLGGPFRIFWRSHPRRGLVQESTVLSEITY